MPRAKVRASAHNRWDGIGLSSGYKPYSPPLPKLACLPPPVFKKDAPKISNPSHSSHPYLAPPVRTRLFSPGFPSLSQSASKDEPFQMDHSHVNSNILTSMDLGQQQLFNQQSW